ncbi:MAG: HAD-IA family hydrolase [Clostridiales bacterium]|jgi:phosphoglycolate phosphatase|nr:HAD-IA family hydrolase [Bacillota bacterium]NLK02830.1 HAD-IA family hydrolase [Clostridiales bacterium]
MEYILIDLDGTISNPKEGITKSIQHALRAFDIHIDDLESLTKHIGPPIRDGFMEFHGFDRDMAEEATKIYRAYHDEKGIYQNELYEGMENLLTRLKEAGKYLIVATSKPEELAIRVLKNFHLEHYFDDICGATFDETRSTKGAVIRYALEKNEIKDLSKVVMVGDRKYDILGAKELGISSIGVLYGFGSEEELKEAGADRIATTVEDVYDTIINF